MRHLALLLLLSMAACGTTATSLPYSPTAAIQQAPRATIGAVAVTDARGESNPNWVGAIRDGVGIPVKRLTTTRPVRDEVATAFIDALTARGLLAPGGPAPYRLDVIVNRLSCNQYNRREGHATFTVSLVDSRSGQTVLQDKAESRVVTGSIITFEKGIFGSVDELRAVTIQAMNQAIDEALNRPGFVAAAGALRVARAGP